jgi:hypothetical protein
MAELAANGKRKIHSASPLTETIADRNWASRFLVILVAMQQSVHPKILPPLANLSLFGSSI